MLTGGTTLSQQASDEILKIKPTKVYIIGGTASVSDDVVNSVKSTTGLTDDNIIRIGGSTRYETSLNIAKYFNLDSGTVTLANGENYPDALSGSALAAKYNAPIILIGDDVTAQKAYIDSIKATNEIILGGTGAIDNSIESTLSK